MRTSRLLTLLEVPRLLTACAVATSATLVAIPANAGLTIVAPAEGVILPTGQVGVEIGGCGEAKLSVSVDGGTRWVDWETIPYGSRSYARMTIDREGAHRISVQGQCDGRPAAAQVSIETSRSAEKKLALAVARNFVATHSADELEWNWGPAIFLYGLSRLGPEFALYLSRYHEHHARHLTRPSFADHCPSALSALELFKRHKDDVGLTSALAVASYLRNERRNALGSLDHLGTNSPVSWTYSSSIWVDSLMMWGAFSVKWGVFAMDRELLDFGLKQPAIFASKLQDPETGLFRHAWIIDKDKPLPRTPDFWLRGNGWVAVSIIEMLEALPRIGYGAKRKELVEIYVKVVRGLLRHQMSNGLWDTIANEPGYSYEELSGAALAAYAIARGVRHGYLPASDLDRARLAFSAISARLQKTRHGYSMPGISWFTVPLPKLAYSKVPLRSDLPYGVGAYLMAAEALSRQANEARR